MSRILTRRLAILAAAAWLVLTPARAEAQKALVYCPVGIDATGCNAIVAALTSSPLFPDGVDAGYDGTSGTVDLAGGDLSGYAVFVVPSLADGPDVQPYSLLRNGTIAGRLQAAFMGRVAVWSGTPDVGSTNRAAKDNLIGNLAAWAKADAAGTHGPGVVALQDNSDDEAGRYGWLGAISVLSVSGDPTFGVYANVQALTSTGQTIITSGGLQIGYTNMASFGLVAGAGGRNDVTGDRTTRVVLVTAAGDPSDPSIATVTTDKDDYTPGDTVTVTGTGWEPGETVSLLFHEDTDPPIHPDKTLNTVADDLGHIFNREYDIDSTDIGVRFTLTATGQTSGRTAQATFTDNKVLDVALAGGGLGTVTGGSPTGINCPTDCSESVDNNANITLTATPAVGSTIGTWLVSVDATGKVGCTTGSTTCAFNMNNKAIDVTVTFNASDLTVTKTHVGTFTVGTPTSYSIVVKNSGSTATSGLVTMTDVQPSGLTFTGATGTGWSCSGTTTVQCTRSDVLAAGASYQAITLTVTPSAAGAVTNTATVSGGGESNTGNNSASDPVTVIAGVNLAINKSHSGNFTLGTNGTYTLAVSNTGGTTTTGTITVTDVLPTGLGFVSFTGTGWACNAPAGTVTCTRSTAITAGNSAPNIVLTVSVAEAAFPSVTNTASVAGGGEPAINNGNNSDSDPTTVLAPDLTIDKSHTGNFTQGVNGTYTLAVSNGGGGSTSGTITVTDVLPTGLGFVSGGNAGGWSTCTAVSQTVTCARTGAINAGGSAPNLSLVVLPGAAAVPSVTNTASVSGGGEPAASNGNNSDSDPTTVGTGVDLTIDKSHTGSFSHGVNGVYSFTVANGGSATTSAAVTVTDVLPTGLAFVSGGNANGWNTCTAVTQTVTCVRPAGNTIAAGASAPALTVTVSVAAAAIPSVTNTASVAGGGEPAGNTGNNSDSDPTTVNTGVDLTIDKSHTGNFTESVNGTYSLAVSNTGGTATSANVTVTDVLPAGLAFVSGGNANGWNTCTVATPTVTCVRPAANSIAAGASAPALAITVSVAAAAVPSVTNTASVAGGGEPAANNGNNSDSDPTTVIAANVAPVVDAGGPYTGDEGTAIPLNTATATDADAGDTPTYKWTYVANGAVDAGTSCSFSNDAIVQPTFTCNDDGGFTVTLTVDDLHGHVVADIAAVTVNNVKPTATAGGPYSGSENSAIELGGTGDDPAANDDDPKLTYKWTVDATGIDAGGACTFDDDTQKNAKVTCTDDGAFSVTLVATDDDGAASTGSTADLTVANVKPVADAGGPYSGDEGAAINLIGSATDVSPNDAITYKWTADVTGIDAGGSCAFADDTQASTTVTCTDNGAFKVKLTATDDDAGSHFEEVALTVANVEPVADAGGPYDGDEGEAISLNGSVTDAGANDTHTWSWQYVAGPGVDAGATCQFDDATAEDPKITCTDDGEVKLTLTVEDDNGGTGVDEATLTLANVKPVANAGGSYPGSEGSAKQLNGSATDAGTNDVISYKWTANVSGLDAGGSCSFDDDTKKDAKVTCTDDGTVTLTLKATDDDGGFDTDDATFTVANVDPVANAGGPYTGNEGAAVNLTGSATDAGANDTHTWSWEYVAGAGVDVGATCSFSDPTAINPTVTCTDDGEVKLTLTVTDDDGGTGVDEATLTLANVAPTAQANGPYPGDEGEAITLNGSATDPAANDVISYKWTADVSGIDGGGSCSFDDDTKKDAKVTCTDDGTATLTLKATDDEGDFTTDNATLTVANVDPVANAGGPYIGNEGAAVPLNGSVTDVGANDTHLWSWQYLAGPGVDAGATCQFSDPTAEDPTVTCTDDGEVKLTLLVTDDDGGDDTAEATLTLSNVAPVAHTNGPYPGTEGSATQLNGTATDAGSNDTFTYLWTASTAGIDAGGVCTFDNASLKNAKVTCTDDGAFTLTLKVTDDDLDFGTEQTTLTVANANPVAVSGGPYTGNEGAAVQLNGSATDAGSNDPLTYLWTASAAGIDAGGACSFDDATKKDAKVTCTDDSNAGSFSLTLTAYDDDGGSGVSSTTLTLQNVKPTIASLTLPDGSPLPATIIVAGTLNLKATFSDPASNDSHKAQIDCGSGYVNVNGGADVLSGFPTSCTFATVGTKTIKVKVTDDDGSFDEKTHTLTVKYNFIGFSAPVDRPNTMNVSKAGQAIPLKWQLLDANGVPVTNLTAVDIKISSLSCGGNVPTDLIEEYASGASGLNNKGGGNYQFNWKTPTNYVGTCRNIGLDFGSGYVEVALAVFNFKS